VGKQYPQTQTTKLSAQWTRQMATVDLIIPLHTMGQNWTTSYPINAPKGLTGSIIILRDSTGSTTSHLQKQTCLSIPVLLLCLDSARVWLLQ